MIQNVDIIIVSIITEIISMLLYIKILKITNNGNIAIIIWGFFVAAVFWDTSISHIQKCFGVDRNSQVRPGVHQQGEMAKIRRKISAASSCPSHLWISTGST